MVSESNRVLVAEDHYVSRHLLERNLMNWGFTVVTAEDGEEALSILESEDAPPLAILDWMMPKMDGLEVCARVCEQALRLPGAPDGQEPEGGDCRRFAGWRGRLCDQAFRSG